MGGGGCRRWGGGVMAVNSTRQQSKNIPHGSSSAAQINA